MRSCNAPVFPDRLHAIAGSGPAKPQRKPQPVAVHAASFHASSVRHHAYPVSYAQPQSGAHSNRNAQPDGNTESN